MSYFNNLRAYGLTGILALGMISGCVPPRKGPLTGNAKAIYDQYFGDLDKKPVKIVPKPKKAKGKKHHQKQAPKPAKKAESQYLDYHGYKMTDETRQLAETLAGIEAKTVTVDCKVHYSKKGSVRKGHKTYSTNGEYDSKDANRLNALLKRADYDKDSKITKKEISRLKNRIYRLYGKCEMKR